MPGELIPQRVCLLRLSALGDCANVVPVVHTLQAAPLWTWLTRTWVLWDSALVEASLDLQAVPAAERTRLQATELRRVARLRSFVTGPIARAAYLLLPGGMAAWWVTSTVASALAARL